MKFDKHFRVAATPLVLSLFLTPITGNPVGTKSYYKLVDDYSGPKFFDKFDFFDSDVVGRHGVGDPTQGWVRYLPRQKAQELGLATVTDNVAKLKVNDKDKYEFSSSLTETNFTFNYNHPAAKKSFRESVRIESKKIYNKALVIADFKHMPNSQCGVWPAFWLFGDPWPDMGEIDVIEGFFNADRNGVALHTGSECIAEYGVMTAKPESHNCWWKHNYNQGCLVKDNRTESYGTGFNANGGGHYVMEWTSDFIKVWFFPRGSAPADILSGTPNPDGWPTDPVVTYNTNKACSIDTLFKNLKIVINTTFCGAINTDGTRWATTGCLAETGLESCREFVARNPEAFKEAYWEVKGIKVFQRHSGTESPAVPENPVVSEEPSVPEVPAVPEKPVVDDEPQIVVPGELIQIPEVGCQR
ncbi:hypothetical protein BJ508DRAFT_324879 [Ascobolus immersus RN42]|uniref:GH16 domain-containing protein n=1 Tax=Ascobolus immersus RN42 TaxID=1160509 RepID=A0A3N4IAA2_ASCIM|nr:hypothetical protein BJ508DRAFT_324879 [Ascobolus immersus RN42]